MLAPEKIQVLPKVSHSMLKFPLPNWSSFPLGVNMLLVVQNKTKTHYIKVITLSNKEWRQSDYTHCLTTSSKLLQAERTYRTRGGQEPHLQHSPEKSQQVYHQVPTCQILLWLSQACFPAGPPFLLSSWNTKDKAVRCSKSQCDPHSAKRMM